MAGANYKGYQAAHQGVESTMQITKSNGACRFLKLRKAKERVETARPFFTMLYDTMRDVAISNRDFLRLRCKTGGRRARLWSSPATAVWLADTMPMC